MIFLFISPLILKLFVSVSLFSIAFSFTNENDQHIKDKIAFQVINDIHSEMDINKDGEINSNEAEEFAQGELKTKSNLEMSKQLKAHLTKDLLWKSWKTSKVYNWTVDDVITWLSIDVELPEYSKVFIRNKINGSMIPRLALSDMSFLTNTLGIRNGTHRKTIAIKSKDLILFGPSKNILNIWKETEAYDVIKNIHSQLDDDKDGGVDPEEASEFVRDELKYTADFDRAKRFNKNDNHISKEELWKNWKLSIVYNWTVDDVIDWLKLHVELAEYVDFFKVYKIDGSTIPRLAASDMSFLIKDLKIKNPVHRKKIVLKATDLILFGPPKKTYSFMKDSILLTLVIVTIGGCWLAYYQHRYSQKQLQSMQDKMNQLGIAEDSLSKLQSKLEEAEEQNSRVNSEKQKIEEKLKSEFEKFKEEIIRDSTEDLFKYRHGDDDTLNVDLHLPEQLKILLQMNYEIEENFFTFKKMAVHQQMQNVKDMCEKLRKKKSSLIGSLRIAHSGNLDDMDKELSEAKSAVDEVRNDLVERSQRWDYIEKLTKFKIIPTPGLSALRSAFTATMNGGNSTFAKNTMIISPSSSALSTLAASNTNTGATTVTSAVTNSTNVTRPKNLPFFINGCSGDSGISRIFQHLNKYPSSEPDDSLSEFESITEVKTTTTEHNDLIHQSSLKSNDSLPAFQTRPIVADNYHSLDAQISPRPIFHLNDNESNIDSKSGKQQQFLNRQTGFGSTDNLDFVPQVLRASTKSLSQESRKNYKHKVDKNYSKIRKNNNSLITLFKKKD